MTPYPLSLVSVLAAEQEHLLLAQEIPEPPRRVEAQRPAPGIERHRLLHLHVRHPAELAEILDAAEMDVGRLPPGIGQVIGVRHVAAEADLQADLPVAEIR